MPKYRILTIDGGGIRGIIPIKLMQRLSEIQALSGWLDQCDLVAGTSTGGILALGIASGISLEELAHLYLTKGEEVFDDTIFDDIRDLGKLIGAEYSNKELRKELKRVFGNRRLSELNKNVLVTAFDLDNEASDLSQRSWKPKIFHNFIGPDSDGEVLVYNVALYTSAAPTYFPAVDGYIDGGVFANNPTMCALAQALDTRQSTIPSLNDIKILSIGTGLSSDYIKGKKLDWGYAQWASPLIRILMDGVSGISDYQCRQILGNDSYHRLQVVFSPDESIPLDAVRKLPRMVELAEEHDLRATTGWIEANWL